MATTILLNSIVVESIAETERLNLLFLIDIINYL